MRTVLLLSLVYLAVASNMIGGFSPHEFDPSESPLDKMALDASLSAIKANDGYTFAGIGSCETQVVSGIKYRLVLNFQNTENQVKQYQVIVYVVPWENYSQVQSVKELPANSQNEAITNKYSSDLSLNKDLRVQILNFAVEQIKMRINDDLTDYKLDSYKVLSMQVVQGNLYNLEITLINSTGQKKSYITKIWVRPWLNPAFEMMSVTDANNKIEQETPTTLEMSEVEQNDQQEDGGFTDFKWDGNSQLEEMAMKALVDYGKQHLNSDFQMGSVISARSQIVAGVNLQLTFNYMIGGEHKVGQATIFIQPWKKIAQVTSFQELQN